MHACFGISNGIQVQRIKNLVDSTNAVTRIKFSNLYFVIRAVSLRNYGFCSTIHTRQQSHSVNFELKINNLRSRTWLTPWHKIYGRELDVHLSSFVLQC